MYVYRGHLGGFYTSPYSLDPEDCYCEQCGDYDWELGDFQDADSFLRYMADEVDVDGSGGWALDFFTEEVNDLFGTDMTQCEIARLVRQYRTVDEDENAGLSAGKEE